ncbi:winged helix-turn-helix domain-containing protein [Stigmatella aurantiaca]|uniref:Transposase n=1 Tax=Stigmatella aurantiaca (strain DW4/3-1) TaxID=378806 RepID=Q08TD9_STIAD|nr:winged helix-turn-helix domain-containing protein [Stigmatella aurantiaca]ADO68405.1 Transposase [Stigmatella aurantiaca DW4/3-1]EAU63753.1 transposase, putative [Stigmatella aurantiaca DW4/3-1]
MRPARSPAELGLTAHDKRKLKRALRQARDARHFRRLLAITLIAEGKGTSPEKVGWASHGWTVPLLCTHLQRQGFEVSARTLRRRLHEAGLAWKRPHYVYATAAPHPGQKKGGSFAV